ncbi:MAG: NAD(P)-dependent oxidoreductase [Bdellovibrionota bacterium]|nr:NAD(P)-dependent oxidoreductase [Bdellovibrionota bacterium]
MNDKKINVLILDRFDQTEYLALRSQASYQVKLGKDNLEAEDYKNADALIIRSTTKINDSLLEGCPNLKLVISTTSGFDHIDLEACEKKSVKAYFTPRANIAAASELCFSLISNLSKNFLAGQKLIRSGSWKRELILGNELEGKKLGIVGFGRIGSRVNRIAKAYGMSTMAYDPYLDPENYKNEVELLGFEEVLRSSDIITVHVPMTRYTKRMFRKNQFESMQEHALLINCSRGNVISEEEMLSALDEGKFKAAALDVFEREPVDPESRIANHPQILCSPHIGGATFESQAKAAKCAREILDAFFKGKEVPEDGTLPPKAPWFSEQII